MLIKYYDRTGEEISFGRYLELHSIPGYLEVAYSEVTSSEDSSVRFRISTIWKGPDVVFENRNPHIFETLVFAGDSHISDENSSNFSEISGMRYESEDEARRGHAEIVASVAATVPYETVKHIR